MKPAWGDDRLEVQAADHPEDNYVGVRVAYYQSNGRFAQSPPHVPPDEETIEDLIRGVHEMAEVARELNQRRENGDINDLIDEIGEERAWELLEQEAVQSDED